MTIRLSWRPLNLAGQSGDCWTLAKSRQNLLDRRVRFERFRVLWRLQTVRNVNGFCEKRSHTANRTPDVCDTDRY